MKRAKATGMNARPSRNLPIPAAAGPARPEKKHATAAGTARGATKNIKKNFFKRSLSSHDPISGNS
jgi:hypothetical protein